MALPEPRPGEDVRRRAPVRPGRETCFDLIDPGTSPADSALGAAPVASASASVSQPPIVSRAAWGADESIRRGTPSYNATVKVGFVHHTDSSNTYSAEQAPSMVRGIYAYHVLSNGWSDIGYNFLVDRYGQIYEGRFGGADKPVLGAHTGGFNVDSFGVSLLGNYVSTSPGSAQKASLTRVLAWKLGMYGRDVQGTDLLTSAGGGTSKYPAGQDVRFNVISGHRDAGKTTCPGTVAYDALPSVRNAAAAQVESVPALVEPSLSGGESAVIGAGDFTVNAAVREPQTWRLTVTNTAKNTVIRTIRGSASNSIAAVWDQRDDAGQHVPAGRYKLALKSFLGGDGSAPFVAPVVLYPHAPAVVANGPYRMDVFSTAGNGNLEHRILSNGVTWTTPRNRGGVISGPPAVTLGAAGLQIFVRGVNDRLYDIGHGRTAFRNLDTTVSASPAAAALADGSNLVFVRGTDGALWVARVNQHGRSLWRSLGGAIVGAPAAASRGGDAVTVAVTGTNNRLYERTLSRGVWGPWVHLGGAPSGPPSLAVVPNTGQLVAFVRGADNALHYTVQKMSTGIWTDWSNLGGELASPPAATGWASSKLQVFAAGEGGAYWGRSYSSPAWSPWSDRLTMNAQ